MNVSDVNKETRERLLEAAGEVFAERGFKEATIREIVRRAGANIAAVNYHFRDKEELYIEVFRYSKNCAYELLEKRQPASAAPQARLEAFIYGLLMRVFCEGRPAWLGKLMAREMIAPTKALDIVVGEVIKPNYERLKEIVSEIIKVKVDNETLRMCVFSIVSQWVFYFHAREVVKRLHPKQKFSPKEIEQISKHITKFSVAALKGFRI